MRQISFCRLSRLSRFKLVDSFQLRIRRSFSCRYRRDRISHFYRCLKPSSFRILQRFERSRFKRHSFYRCLWWSASWRLQGELRRIISVAYKKTHKRELVDVFDQYRRESSTCSRRSSSTWFSRRRCLLRESSSIG